MANKTYFKKITPEIVEVGDIYLAPFAGTLKPTIVSNLDNDRFSFTGEYCAGTHQYGLAGGILLKEKDGKLGLFAEDSLLSQLDILKDRLDCLI